jgi:hypothetical protein
MNILPAVLAFILLITMMSLTFFQSASHADYLAYKQTGYMKVKRDLQSALENEAYNPHRPKAISKDSKNGSRTKARNHYRSERLKPPLNENNKLNISPLFTVAKEPNLLLEKTLKKLILILYHEKKFFAKEGYTQEELAVNLVKSLIEKGRGKETLEALTDLYPKDPFLQNLFYKMLKSATPLSDYITLIEKKERKPVCFKYAPTDLLTALFNEKITEAILKKEEENYFAHEKGSPILQAHELKEILSRSSFAGQIETLIPLIEFGSPKNSKKTLRRSDVKTGITLSYTIKKQ